MLSAWLEGAILRLEREFMTSWIMDIPILFYLARKSRIRTMSKTLLILQIIQISIMIGGLIIGLRQIILLFNQKRDEHIWKIKKETFDYLNMYIRDLNEINIKLQKEFDLLNLSGRKIDEAILLEKMKDETTRANLFHLVTYFENLAIGIKEGFFDNKVAKLLLFNVLVSTYNSLMPYINLRRKETGFIVAGEFEKLFKRWDIERI